MIGRLAIDWPAPDHVVAVSTTRVGGVSLPPYDSLNLAMHTGDDPQAVSANRQRLSEDGELPAGPRWLEQVHGRDVIEMTGEPLDVYRADAAFTRESGVVCAVLTADCLPLLMTDRAGTVVAAVHAGWRGLHAGVISATVDRMGVEGSGLMVWMGPSIGPRSFEVGEELRQAFIDKDPVNDGAFRHQGSRIYCDIYELARRELRSLDIEDIHGGGYCTFEDAERFYSYRRDGAETGRQAHLIWLR